MLAQRLDLDISAVAASDQLWQYIEAAWAAILQGNFQSLFASVTIRVASIIANKGGYTIY